MVPQLMKKSKSIYFFGILFLMFFLFLFSFFGRYDTAENSSEEEIDVSGSSPAKYPEYLSGNPTGQLISEVVRQKYADGLKDEINAVKRPTNSKKLMLTKYLKVPLKKHKNALSDYETEEEDDFTLGSSNGSTEDETESFDPPPPDPSPIANRKDTSSPINIRKGSKSPTFPGKIFICLSFSKINQSKICLQ